MEKVEMANETSEDVVTTKEVKETKNKSTKSNTKVNNIELVETTFNIPDAKDLPEVKKFQKEIDFYTDLLEKRMAEKEQLELEYTITEQETDFEYTSLLAVINDLKRNFKWTTYEAIWLTRTANNIASKLENWKAQKKAETDPEVVNKLILSNLDIEGLDLLIRKHSAVGFSLAEKYSRVIIEMNTLFSKLQKNKAPINVMEKLIEIINFKLTNYKNDLETAPERDDIELAMREGLPKED